MMLSARIMNRDKEIRSFSLFNSDLETGFDVLNRIVQSGNILLEVAILEEDQWIQLPVEAFDGQSCLSAINDLIHESQRLVGASLNRSNLTYK